MVGISFGGGTPPPPPSHYGKPCCHQFIANFSTMTELLQRLTKKNQKFIWGKEQEEAFQTLKQKLTSAEVMCYYNPIAETNIVVDARPKGLGAVLSQKRKNRQFKPIYSSRALTDVESLYGHVHKYEAVLWTLEKLRKTIFCYKMINFSLKGVEIFSKYAF